MADFDVLVLGEPMIERHRDAHGRPDAEDSVSGDAVNAACAAALAGARVALLSAVGRDDGGDLVLRELARCGVHTGLVRRGTAPTGAYTVSPDATGQPRFSYQRAGSAAAGLGCAELAGWLTALDSSPVLVTSGITSALSAGTAELVLASVRRVAAAGGMACYDVNYRPNLTNAEAAARELAAVAPHCRLVKIASPADSGPLLGVTDPDQVVARLGVLTGAAVLVSQGEQPLTLAEAGRVRRYPALPMPAPVDTTGAGDVLLGTLAAALASGETAAAALPAAVVAAGLSTRHRGGAPRATRAQVLATLAAGRTLHPSTHPLKEE